MTRENARRTAWALGALVLLLGSWWRIDTLDRRPLWLDERWTERFVRGAADLAAVWDVARQDDYQHPPLAYAVQWAASAGEPTPVSLRLPSLVAGIAGIALVAWLGTSSFGATAGLFAAFAIAISIYHVDFSQDARPYAMGATWTLASYLGLLLHLRSRGAAALATFAACTLAALYTYHLAVLHLAVAMGVAALDVLAAAKRRDGPEARRRALRWGIAFGAVALLYAPQAPNLFHFLSTAPGAEPNHRLWITPRFLDALVQRWASASGWTVHLYELAFVAGAIQIARRRDPTSLVFAGWLLAPMAVFALRPFAKYFDIRFLISSLPAFFLVAGFGFAEIARAAGAIASRVVGARVATRVRTLAAVALVAVCLAPALHLQGLLRNATRRCGDFMNIPGLFEENERLCADHLLLTTIHEEHQFIVKSVRPSVDLTPDQLAEYAGAYVFPDGTRMVVTNAGTHLVAQTEKRLRFQLVAAGDDRFFYRVVGHRDVRFERSPAGGVIGLTLQAPAGTGFARREADASQRGAASVTQ